ncbi:MAG: thiol:disulfide interchange protein DsbA/DsbL [Pseudomonadota bacterium]|nr:thiol:disulfide interchange protein DsbA/DsbL [Pseudomonadota bacterium]
MKKDGQLEARRCVSLRWMFCLWTALVFGLSTATQALAEIYTEGTHYTRVSDPGRVHQGELVEVVEFMSYGCAHCSKMEPHLNPWVEEHEDRIDFVRITHGESTYNSWWGRYGQAFYACKALGVVGDKLEQIHHAFFEAIHHDHTLKSNKRQIAKFLSHFGISEKQFYAAYDSPDVESLVEDADQLWRRFSIRKTPTFIVNGKYEVNPGDLSKLDYDDPKAETLKVIEYLVQLESGTESAQALTASMR